MQFEKKLYRPTLVETGGFLPWCYIQLLDVLGGDGILVFTGEYVFGGGELSYIGIGSWC